MNLWQGTCNTWAKSGVCARSAHDRPHHLTYSFSRVPAVVTIVGIHSSSTYLDDRKDTPEFNTILISDHDGAVKSRCACIYAEEHHLDGRKRKIIRFQLPFGADGENVDQIVEYVSPTEG